MSEVNTFLTQFGPLISSFLVGISSNLGTDVVKTFAMYEISNLKTFFSSNKFSVEKFTAYAKSPQGLRTLSLVIDRVRSEAFQEKIETWGSVTSSIISGYYDDSQTFNRRDFFIQKFTEMNEFSVKFLASLGKSDFDYTKTYEILEGGNRVLAGKEAIAVAQNFLNINGFCEIYVVTNPLPARHMIRLSPLGIEFLKFIHGEFEKTVSS